MLPSTMVNIETRDENRDRGAEVRRRGGAEVQRCGWRDWGMWKSPIAQIVRQTRPLSDVTMKISPENLKFRSHIWLQRLM